MEVADAQPCAVCGAERQIIHREWVPKRLRGSVASVFRLPNGHVHGPEAPIAARGTSLQAIGSASFCAMIAFAMSVARTQR